MSKRAMVYIGNFGFPDKNASGKRVLGNCLLLRELGYEPICIGPGDGSELTHEGIVCHTLKVGGSISRVLKSNPEPILSLLRQKKEAYDEFSVILYGALYTQAENLGVVKWCKQNGVRVYYDQVDWFELNWHNPLRALIRANNHRLMNKKVIPSCDGVICISEYLSSYHQKKGRKTVVIPPLATSVNDGAQHAETGETLTFVYAGTTTDVARPRKQWKDRIDLMFSEMAKVCGEGETRDFCFEIFGLTEEQYIRMFPQKEREEGKRVLAALGDRVRFHGSTPNARVMEETARANFSVLIRESKRSTNAGFPTKVSESLSCGTPVICTDTSDLKNFVHNGENGYVCTIEELSDVYRSVLCLTDEELTQLKRNCNAAAFFYGNYTDRVANFLREVEEQA